MNKVRLLLASSSPRRLEILSSLGLVFGVAHADIDENPLPGESAENATIRLAEQKALKISRSHPDALVIGADTLVALNGKILGKPESRSRAVEILNLLNGKTHEVFTGVAIIKADENLREIKVCRSEVCFKDLSGDEIAEYVSSGEPLGKAGAYAIQGKGAALVQYYNGSLTNIVGLPVTETLQLFERFGNHRLVWNNC